MDIGSSGSATFTTFASSRGHASWFMQCRELLTLYRNRRLTAPDLRQAVAKQMEAIRRKRAELQSLEAALRKLVVEAMVGTSRPGPT